MHLLIKPTEHAQPFYINHSNYHEGDAGLDIFTLEDITIPAGKMGKIDTGIACEALTDDKSKGLSFFTFPRSSIIKTPLRLANSVGIIDRDYRGHLIGFFDNNSESDYVVEKGTRLLQICAPNLEPITFELVEEISETSRGTGGFGSTGK